MKPTWLAAAFAAWAAAAAAQSSGVIGEEEFVSSLFMERPSVATDSLGQPHVVGDAGGNTRFMKFHKVGDAWGGGVFAVGSPAGRYSASRLYVGQIEIDPRDRAWISCKFGVKEYGSMYGQGIWLFRNVATSPNPPEQFFRFVCVYKGMGVVTTDAKYPDQGIVIGTFGNFAILYANGSTLGTGSINAGPGGEKVRARIASYAPRFGAGDPGDYPDGVWHTAMNGYSASSSRYQNSLRYKAGLGPVEWAAYYAYPEQGSDFSHPGVGIDRIDPRICYIGSVFRGRLCLNIWDGSAMRFNTANLKVLDYAASYEIRHGPAFAPALNGGTYVFWTSGGRIRMAHVSADGAVSPVTDVTAGRSPAAATDRFGNLHLVYYNGGIRYRRILTAALDPLRPAGRVTGTRTPAFAWTDSQAPAYTLELALDGEPFPPFTVGAASWTPPLPLPTGDYAWRVKEGEASGTEPWSRTLAFSIPPPVPAPATPAGRLPEAVAPLPFAWSCDDPDANRFKVELFQGTDRIGAFSSDTPSGSWAAPLGPGEYGWRVKALHQDGDYTVGSAWSPLQAFQVAVPGAVAFTEPGPLARMDPGPGAVTCSWTPADGAGSYTLTVLHNGNALQVVPGLSGTSYTLARVFQPGYHTLLLQGVNGAGTGPASPARTFVVDRLMIPSADSVLTTPPPAFSWTRSRGATRYLFKLYRWDDRAGRYKVASESWVAQRKGNPVAWNPGATWFAGRYRWTITDYNGDTAGFTSIGTFRLQDPP